MIEKEPYNIGNMPKRSEIKGGEKIAREQYTQMDREWMDYLHSPKTSLEYDDVYDLIEVDLKEKLTFTQINDAINKFLGSYCVNFRINTPKFWIREWSMSDEDFERLKITNSKITRTKEGDVKGVIKTIKRGEKFLELRPYLMIYV